MGSHLLSDHPVYSVYAALDSAALLALLPELDRWHEKYLSALRMADQVEAKAPEDDAAMHEQLNEARVAVLGRVEREPDPAMAESWRRALEAIDIAKSASSLQSEKFRESPAIHIRDLSVMLNDLMQRRWVAVKVLSDRGILPPNLVGE